MRIWGIQLAPLSCSEPFLQQGCWLFANHERVAETDCKVLLHRQQPGLHHQLLPVFVCWRLHPRQCCSSWLDSGRSRFRFVKSSEWGLWSWGWTHKLLRQLWHCFHINWFLRGSYRNVTITGKLSIFLALKWWSKPDLNSNQRLKFKCYFMSAFSRESIASIGKEWSHMREKDGIYEKKTFTFACPFIILHSVTTSSMQKKSKR